MVGVIGFGKTALLKITRARGVDPVVAAELLPHVEAALVETPARQARSGGGDDRGGDADLQPDS